MDGGKNRLIAMTARCECCGGTGRPFAEHQPF
jgi:hypothetical protein